ASSSVLVTGFGTYSFNSTSQLIGDVQSWVNAPASNFGWLLLSENESTPRTARRLGTREDPAHIPVLIVDYTPPVGSAVSITTQPQSQTAFVGSTVFFNVVAGGTPPFSYQWFFNSNAISGATSDT